MASCISCPIKLQDFFIVNISGKNWHLSFLHEVSHQKNVAYETTSFCWVWLVLSLVQSGCWNLWLGIPLERIKWHLNFFCVTVVIKGRYRPRLILLAECGQMFILSNQIVGLFFPQYHWNTLINILDFLHGDNHQKKVECELSVLIRCDLV